MATNRTPLQIELEEPERERLEQMAHGQVLPHRMVVRAKLILALAGGQTVSAAGRGVGVQRRIARKWGQRFMKKRIASLSDAPRSGRPVRFSPPK